MPSPFNWPLPCLKGRPVTDLEDKGRIVLQNAGKYLPKNSASLPRTLEPLSWFDILHCMVAFCNCYFVGVQYLCACDLCKNLYLICRMRNLIIKYILLFIQISMLYVSDVLRTKFC